MCDSNVYTKKKKNYFKFFIYLHLHLCVSPSDNLLCSAFKYHKTTEIGIYDMRILGLYDHMMCAMNSMATIIHFDLCAFLFCCSPTQFEIVQFLHSTKYILHVPFQCASTTLHIAWSIYMNHKCKLKMKLTGRGMYL